MRIRTLPILCVFCFSTLFADSLSDKKEVDSIFNDADKEVIIDYQEIIDLFKENKVQQIVTPPKINIAEVSVCGKKIDLNNNTIPWRQTLTIVCTSETKNHEDTSYEYRIIGLNDQWVPTSSKHFEFVKLNTGRYTFEYRAKLFDSVWSQSAIYSFSVLKPFWMKPFAITIYISIIMYSILYMSLKYSNKKYKTRLEKLKHSFQLNLLKQNSLQNMMKPHFIFNILNSINYYLQTNDTQNASSELKSFSRLIRKNLDMSQENFITLEEELDFIEQYLDLEKKRTNNKFSFKIKRDIEINPTVTKIPTLLIQPFLENAILHGVVPKDGKGKISINFSKHDKFLKISIKDDGVGYNPKERMPDTDKSIHGISIAKQRIAILNDMYGFVFNLKISKLYEFENEKHGTLVELTLPISIKS